MKDSIEKKVWEKYQSLQQAKEFTFGPHYSYQLRNTPRHILFTLSRYKFAAKMIGSEKEVLELGCNEGLGSYYLSEFSRHVTGIDFDERAVKWAQANYTVPRLSFAMDDFLGKKYGNFDAVVSYDVIEHISKENEELFMDSVVLNLSKTGLCLIGTPNIESHKFANPEIAGAHINLYSWDALQLLAEKYFHNVFLFSQNDEMIHTGYAPMAHYLIVLCCSKKISGSEDHSDG